MNETILSVIDFINRQGIDNSCWGLHTIYEENENKNTSFIFGTRVKDLLPKGTYLYLYLTKEQLTDISNRCQQPANIYLIDDALGMSSTPWVAIWKLL